MAGNSVTIHANTTKGPVTVYASTHSDVFGNFTDTKVIDAGSESSARIKFPKTSKLFIAVISGPRAVSQVKYTIDECTPAQSELIPQYWHVVPVNQQKHCSYVLVARKGVSEGTDVTVTARATKGQMTISVGTDNGSTYKMLLHSARKVVTIRARATKGKVTLSTGTRSKLRQQLTSTMALDTARANEDHFQFTTSASSKVYIGVKLDSPDATCLVKYTTSKRVAPKLGLRRVVIQKSNHTGFNL